MLIPSLFIIPTSSLLDDHVSIGSEGIEELQSLCEDQNLYGRINVASHQTPAAVSKGESEEEDLDLEPQCQGEVRRRA
jgi:hypothetical protein